MDFAILSLARVNFLTTGIGGKDNTPPVSEDRGRESDLQSGLDYTLIVPHKDTMRLLILICSRGAADDRTAHPIKNFGGRCNNGACEPAYDFKRKLIGNSIIGRGANPAR